MMDGHDGSRHRALSFPFLPQDWARIMHSFDYALIIELAWNSCIQISESQTHFQKIPTNLELDYPTKCFEFKDLKVKGRQMI